MCVKAGSRSWYSGCDTPLNAIAPFNDAYEITKSIALLFLLKDEIFLFATHVACTRQTQTRDEQRKPRSFKLHRIRNLRVTLNPC